MGEVSGGKGWKQLPQCFEGGLGRALAPYRLVHSDIGTLGSSGNVNLPQVGVYQCLLVLFTDLMDAILDVFDWARGCHGGDNDCDFVNCQANSLQTLCNIVK